MYGRQRQDPLLSGHPGPEQSPQGPRNHFMNTASHSASPEQAAELFARRLTARLSADTDALPYDISERLRAAREQALAQRKKVVPVREWHHAAALQRQGHTATLGNGDNEG